MAPPAARPLLQRDTILAEARALIIADGLDALSLRGLASNLGVTAPALYAHVRDKQDLLRSLAEAEFDVLMARFEAVDDADPVERIRGQARAYVAHARENPELFKLMFLFPPDFSVSAIPDEVKLPAATKAFTVAAAAIDEAVQAGRFTTDDPLLLSMTVWAGMHGVAEVLGMGLALTPEFEDSLVDEVIDRILAGYGA